MRQRYYRLGPQSLEHWPGELNGMADVPSRSYSKGYPAHDDEGFLRHFSHLFPLPPQLGFWELAQPRTEICSAAFTLLRKIRDNQSHLSLGPGGIGVNLPDCLINTLTSQISRDPPTTWNESTCSWPLLLPCGRACSVEESPLQGRRSRARYESAPRSFTIEDLRTLGNAMALST